MTSATVYTYILFSIFLTGTSTVTAQGVSSLSLLSQLFNTQSQSKPLVLVLSKNNVREEPKYPLKPNNLVGESLETDEEVPTGVYLIQNQVPPPAPSQKRVPSPGGPGNLGGLGELYDLLSKRPKADQAKVNRGHLAGSGKTTPSSIQKILRQSECDASDACVDKCQKRLEGKQRTTCKVKCEVTFECPPITEHNEDYDDPCEDAYNEC